MLTRAATVVLSFIACFILLVIASLCRSASERTRRQMKHVTATVLAVTAAFVICWTPSHVVRFMSLHKQWMYASRGAVPTRDDVVVFRVFNTIAQALIFASSCCNPFIYCISSSNFSKSLLRWYNLVAHVNEVTHYTVSRKDNMPPNFRPYLCHVLTDF